MFSLQIYLGKKAKDMGCTDALECTSWPSYRDVYVNILLLSAVIKPAKILGSTLRMWQSIWAFC
jgi:hypothetical protein